MMKFSYITTGVVVAGLFTTCAVANADLTRQGAVGLPLNPTAQIPDNLGVRVQANYFDGGDAKVSGIYAAGRVGRNLEVNGGLEGVNGDGIFDPLDETSFAIGAKYLISNTVPNPTGIQVAAGIGHSRAQFRNTYAYLVGTTRIPGVGAGGNSALGHLGVRYDSFDTNTPLIGGEDKSSIYGGVEVPVTRDGRWQFVGELQTKNSNNSNSKSPYSAAVRYRAGAGLSATAGVMRDGFTGEAGLFAQVGKTF